MSDGIILHMSISEMIGLSIVALGVLTLVVASILDVCAHAIRRLRARVKGEDA